MGRARSYGVVTGVLVTATTAGCSLTPMPETPSLVTDIQTQGSYTHAPAVSSMRAEPNDWWKGVGGDELHGLVETLIEDSLTLQEARLQAIQAFEGTRLARSQRLPGVSVFGEVSAARTQTFGGDFSWSESYTTGVLADFNTDVFGGLRASQRAAELNARASALSVRAAEQREIALLARNWVSAVTLKRRLDLAERTAASFRATFELTDQRYGAGSASVSASDVQIAQQNLETALVDIPQIETDLASQFLLIDEQLARLPGESEANFVSAVLSVDDIARPIGTPAELLAQRPDVAAAELRYLAALEDVGAARSTLYPALSLSASLTFQADTPGEVFDWERHIASLANALTAPLFQGGALRSQVRLEQAQAEELATAFARTALAAVIDVELALVNLSGLQIQREGFLNALETAKLSNELSQGRYQQGLTSILAVLETQRSLNAAEQNLILTEQALANAQIDLFLSLGGDWSGEDGPAADLETLLFTDGE
ncbi:MAG: efflux transporter outer membrane subunit [Pseudomonadota bacterium]